MPPLIQLHTRAVAEKVMRFQPARVVILKIVFPVKKVNKVTIAEVGIVMDLVVKKLSQVMKIPEMTQSLSQ